MKQYLLLLFTVTLSLWMFSANAQNVATNVEIQNENIAISASGDIKLSTGTSGKAYYNDKEVAVKSDAGRGATLVIAASNATEKSKAGADYVCTGQDDQEVFNTALNSLPESGGLIQLTEGDFHFSNTAQEAQKDVTIQGSGASTVIHRHFVCISGRYSDSLLRANPKCKWHFKDFVINSNNMLTQGYNNYDIFCWTPESGKSEGTCTISNVHVINGLVHHTGDNTIAFFISGTDGNIKDCSVQGGSYTNTIHTSLVYKEGINVRITGCDSDGSININASTSFVTNNKSENLYVNSYQKAVVTGNISNTLSLGGYKVFANGNICDVLNNQTNYSLVVNNLLP